MSDREEDTLDKLKPGDMVWIKHANDVETIPLNAFNTKRHEPVRIVSLPGKRERRFYVESLFREGVFFHVSEDRFLTSEEYEKLTGAQS